MSDFKKGLEERFTKDRQIVIVFLVCLMLIPVIGTASFAIGYDITAGLFLAAFTTTAVVGLYKLWIDNRNRVFPISELPALVPWAIVLWLPFAVTFFIGMSVTTWADQKLEQGVEWADSKAQDKIVIVNRRVERLSRRYWYDPRTWWRSKIRDVVPERRVEKVAIYTKLLFGLVYSLLRMLQYGFYTMCLLVFFKSFGFVLARVAVWKRVTKEFSLPSP